MISKVKEMSSGDEFVDYEKDAIEIICAFFSAVALILMVIVLVYLCIKDIKVEKNFKIVLIIDGLAITMRAVYNFIYLAVADKNESNDEL